MPAPGQDAIEAFQGLKGHSVVCSWPVEERALRASGGSAFRAPGGYHNAIVPVAFRPQQRCVGGVY